MADMETTRARSEPEQQYIAGYLTAAGYVEGCSRLHTSADMLVWGRQNVPREEWSAGAVECQEVYVNLPRSNERFNAALKDQQAADERAADIKAAFDELGDVLRAAGYTVRYVERPWRFGIMQRLLVHARAGAVASPVA